MRSVLRRLSGAVHLACHVTHQAILPLGRRAVGVLLAQGEDRHAAFLAEVLVADRGRQESDDEVLAVARLIAVLLQVPGKHPHLVEVAGQPVLVLVQQHEVLRHFLVFVVHGVQHKGRLDALSFGVLCHVERNFQVHHARQHPANVALRIAHLPPVVHRVRLVFGIFFGLGGRRADVSCRLGWPRGLGLTGFGRRRSRGFDRRRGRGRHRLDRPFCRLRSRLILLAGQPGQLGGAVRRDRFGSGAQGGRAPQHLHLAAFRQLVKRIGLAPRTGVHVQFGAGDALALHRSLLVLAGHARKLIEDFARHQRAHFDPAFLLLVGAHAGKAPLALQYLHPLAVLDRAHAVVHRGHVVAQVGLRRGNVHVLARARQLAVLASGGKDEQQTGRHQQHLLGAETAETD